MYTHDPNAPLYYVRMRQAGQWFFMLKQIRDRKRGGMQPIWCPEDSDSVPYLYKTLAKARNTVDRLDLLPSIQCEAQIWAAR